MSAWKPTTREPDPLHAAIYDLARHLLFPDAVAPKAIRHEEGWLATLPDGRAAFLKITFNLLADRRYGPRAVAVYELRGLATSEREGYSVTGRVIVDAATRAFLDVECRCQPLGHVDGTA